jgi:hypothetical protein
MKYDTVAHQVAIALLDHIADMDANPKLDPALGRQAGMRSTIPFCTSMARRTASTSLLNSMRTPSPSAKRRARDAERWGRVDQTAAERAWPRKCPLLVGSCQLAVSGYVCRENCCEFPGPCHECPSRTSQTNMEHQPGRRSGHIQPYG